jgi:hypothetical protein
MPLLLPQTGSAGAALMPALFRHAPTIATYATTTLEAIIAATGNTFHSSHSANPNGTKLDDEGINFAGGERSTIDSDG